MANKHLHGQGLVLALTSACMTSWYQLVNKFSSRPEVYDVAPGKFHDSYNIIKMNPGVDVRDETYQYLQDTTTKLTKSLNKLFNREIFVPKITRGPDSLETLVAFAEGKGGIFQVKGSMSEGSASIFLTMPNEEQLQKAFSSMTGTPHPEDMLDDESPTAEPVAGEAIPDFSDEPDEFAPKDGIDSAEVGREIPAPRQFGEGFRAYVLGESKEVWKVVYTENDVKKEEIVSNEQQATQIARRKKGKVVSQVQEVKQAKQKWNPETERFERPDGNVEHDDTGKGDKPGQRHHWAKKELEESGARFKVVAIGKDGQERTVGTNNVGRMAQVDFNMEKTGQNKEVILYDGDTVVKKWTNPKMEENVSVGQAMGTPAQSTVYEPNAKSGFTGGPFGGKVKRRNNA